MDATLEALEDGLCRRMYQSVPLQGRWLKQVVTGHFDRHVVPTNSGALAAFRAHIVDLWRRTLGRRSRSDASTWTRIARIADDGLPKPRILHPWPHQRFDGSVRGAPRDGRAYRDRRFDRPLFHSEIL